jgi:beta-lactamase regulating signal transducer with metallopeptidase domain
VIKLTFVLLIGLVATAVLRKSSAALRHWVLTVSIVCAALVPVLQLIVPGWQLPFRVAAPWTTDPIALVVPLGLEHADANAAHASVARGRAPIGERATRAATVLWIAGTGIGLLLLAAGRMRLSWLSSRSTKLVDGPWREQSEAVSRELGLGDVELLQSDHPALLATWGWLRPRVLLPADAGGWPLERIRIVVAHELAHVARHDWLVQMGASIFQAIYWFNPVIWIACRTLRRQSELACDDAVLRLGVEARAYAGHLLAIARDLRSAQRVDIRFPAPAMARQSSLERRVRAMLNTDRNRVPVSRVLGICAALTLFAVTLPVAGLLASSQSGGARFSGSVMDAVGRMMPNLALVLTSRQDRTRHEAVSDVSGRFEFRDLAPGEYVIGIERPGFDPVQGRVLLQPGDDLEQDVALQVGSVQEAISVTASDVDRPPPARAPQSKTELRAVREACADSTAGGCIEPPIKLLDVLPQYPRSKRDARVDAHVQLEGRIGTDGFVKELRLAVPAESDFAHAATEAVSAWRFAPTRLGGVPIETPIKIAIDFVTTKMGEPR